MTAPCANGCIPSSPHVGCPVHAAPHVVDMVAEGKCICFQAPELRGGALCPEHEAKPPEPCGRATPADWDIPGCCSRFKGHGGNHEDALSRFYSEDSIALANPPPQPEPAPYSDGNGPSALVPRVRLDKAEAQLAAAQTRVKELEEQRDTKQTLQAAQRDSFERQAQAATERAEKAEAQLRNWMSPVIDALTSERDAAIKAKEEAEARQAREVDVHAAQMQNASIRRDAAEATAGALRAALERVKEALGKDSVSQAWDAAYEALAAHSKAVGP